MDAAYLHELQRLEGGWEENYLYLHIRKTHGTDVKWTRQRGRTTSGRETQEMEEPYHWQEKKLQVSRRPENKKKTPLFNSLMW